MSESYKKLIKTLQTIFEMDKADLDFGIYRIMNQKRDDINKFLEDDLLPQVKQAFDDYSSEGQGDLQQELSTAIEQAKNLGAPDPENVPTVLEIKAKMANAVDATALENDVFSKLHTFFSRYYDQGDFISQRRYKADTYAIPYQGEEVKLYWANHDQYYIKSSEHLRDYAFLAKEGANDDKKSVRIKLMEADTEKDNIKAKAGKERRFVLDEECPLSEEDGELLIHFNFIQVGKQKQEKLNDAAVETILAQDGFDEWLNILKALAPTEAKPKRTLLERHLNEYTARNTFDYFIHKDLGGFLNRELDFFIKNEVLFLDDIDDAAFSVTEQQLRKIKIIRAIAKKVIHMLAQLETFQKKMWLKKKFVIETNYCISIDLVPENLLSMVFENEGQIKDWEKIYSLDRSILNDIDFNNVKLSLETLPEISGVSIDTKNFDNEFKVKLIASFENIDNSSTGVLLNADNFQGLNFLDKKLRKNVRAIYIDPPYNTDAAPILYKNGYRDSSWLSFLNDRLLVAKELLTDNGVLCATIDDYEQKVFSSLIENAFSSENMLGSVVIRMNPSGRITLKGLAQCHEYAIFAGKSEKASISKMDRTDEQKARFNHDDEIGAFEWRNFRREGSSSDRVERPKRHFPIYVLGKSLRVPEMDWDEQARSYINIKPPQGDEQVVWPVDSTGRERVWRWGIERINAEIYEILPKQNNRNVLNVYYKYRPNEDGITPPTVWVDKKYSATEYGTNELKKLFGNMNVFDFPKSIHAVEDCIDISGMRDASGLVLDFFAGSGTTGSAVINLNRKDGGERKFCLVEMGAHCQELIKPRLLKSSYSSEWKNGKPQKQDSKSVFIKYMILETYEDVLNNLDLGSSKFNKDFLEENKKLKEDYILGYWLDVETADSSSLLNIKQFEDPFNYKLNIGSGSVGATKPTTVDLVETFNYLIGLTVKTIDVLKGFKLVMGTNPQGETVLVVWRNIKENDNAALESFLDKQGYNPRDTEFDHIYVNGDHTLEDPQSKVKMTEIEFKRLMFDVSDV